MINNCIHIIGNIFCHLSTSITCTCTCTVYNTVCTNLCSCTVCLQNVAYVTSLCIISAHTHTHTNTQMLTLLLRMDYSPAIGREGWSEKCKRKSGVIGGVIRSKTAPKWPPPIIHAHVYTHVHIYCSTIQRVTAHARRGLIKGAREKEVQKMQEFKGHIIYIGSDRMIYEQLQSVL